jgi:hypothetical protein
MTKFEELTDIITHDKNKDKKLAKKIFDDIEDDDIELEVSGSESRSAPLVASTNEETDPDIIDMLYTKPRHKPNDGFGASPGTPFFEWSLESLIFS